MAHACEQQDAVMGRLATHLEQTDFLDEQIESCSAQIATHLDRLAAEADLSSGAPPSPLAAPDDQASAAPQRDGGASPPLTGAQAVALLDTIPGIGPWQAEVILAEIGLDMTRWDTIVKLLPRPTAPCLLQRVP